MGSKLCIDKHVSNIEDILEMNPASFSKVKIEESIPDYVTQHIKIWRYYNDGDEPNSIKSTPISLKDILNTSFNFVSNECYLVLFVYKKQSEEPSPLFAFPHSMWGVIESYTNLTPRGLEAPVASSESVSNLSKEVLESFLLPRRTPAREDNKFEYMLFVWNGKTANPLMKAMVLSAALEFDTMISKGKDPFLQVLFSGGYVRNKKLWMGKVLQLDSSVTKQNDADFEKRFDPVKETVYLLKFLFPSAERGLKPKGFKERFLKGRRTEGRQDDEYLIMGDGMDEEEQQEEFEEEELQEEEREHEEYNENEYEPDQDAEELTEDLSPGESPASLFGHAGHEYEDFPPLESSRRGAGHQVVPKLLIMRNNDAEEDNGRLRGIGSLGLGNLGNIGNIGNAAAGGGEKVKKMIPNLKLGRLGGQESANVEVKLDAQNLNGGRAAESYEKSEEERQPASSDRTSESQDSRRRSERRKVNNVTSNNNRGQIASLALGNLGQKKPLVMNYEDLRRQSQDDMYDAKESDIKRCKKEYYSEQCSELLENFLYVAGETIAYNEKKLKEYGITHIVNAAGDACESKFADRLKYLTYYIKDSRVENIECVFYEAAAFIESARQEGGRVLVHCVQGVSRSVALCMAYLILKHQFTFGKAYEHVRNIREIASPNPAFWAQLYNFQIRLYGPFDTIPSPRVFVIGSYQRETPQTLVARLLFETGNLFNAKSPKTLDPRTVVVLQSKDSLFLWIGNEILPANEERYIAKAEEQIKLLQQYEHASQDYNIVHCGEEPREFWSLWEHEPQNKYGRNKEWDLWLVDLASHKNVVGTTIYEEQDEDEPAVAYPRPGLYCYPELEPLKSIDLEELIDENLLILCTQKDDTKVAYVWRGTNVPPEVEDQTYLANVLRQRWPETDPSAITIVNEVPNNESESFVDYFQ